MPIRNAKARWEGGLPEGRGSLGLGSGAFEGQYSYGSRFEEGRGTNPEELIGAAHAGCFSMALAGGLGRAGFPPERVRTSAKVHIEKGDAGFRITRIDLTSRASVPGIDDATFQEQAEATKTGCPVSQALTGTEITLDAALA